MKELVISAYLCAILTANVQAMQHTTVEYISDCQVINLGPAFEQFWAQASGKPFEKQVHLWEEIIEKQESVFYDSVAWEKLWNTEWQERKNRRLSYIFSQYPVIAPAMKEIFNSFNTTIEEHLARFRRLFPSSCHNLLIYVVPAPVFNGVSSVLGDGQHKRNILAFGIDMICILKDNIGNTFAHELFHYHHAEKVDMQENGSKNTLLWHLWMDGLAQFASKQINPEAPREAILMSPQLATLSSHAIARLASRFLQDLSSPENNHEGWFSSNKNGCWGPALPERCGYALGLTTIERLAQSYTLEQMATWTFEEMHPKVITTLEQLSHMEA